MYIFKPVTEQDKLRELFGVTTGAGYIGYENNETVGSCHFESDGYFVTVDRIICDDEDKELCEGLIRSALGYCANRNAYIGKCSCFEKKDVLEIMGFELENDIYSGDIPTLLGGSCGCCR